jgi:ABC-type polysaccharide/polyol phosphate transport system ATPase subunit
MKRRPVVSIDNVSKAYTLYERPRDIFKEAIFGGTRHDVFWALKDISFDVFEGERVGVVGPNGAGKSTLLQVVTGNLTPTTGTVQVHGRISAMLSLTSFLNPHESGLDNVRFNLLLAGVDKSELPRLTDGVVEFAELGGFIYAPVRTYSTGMNARLAFSIATVTTPDVLVVDEVLGVGDAYFAAKATARMIELANEGRALFFVSHSSAAVRLLCNRAIWLDQGGIRAIGAVDDVVRQYEDDSRREVDERVRPGNIARRRLSETRVAADELSPRGLTRIRVVGAGGRVRDTHYVRRVEVAVGNAEPEAISLYVEDMSAEGVGSLDLFRSEWGRAHSRKGHESRALAPAAKPLRGGHILIRQSHVARDGDDLRITIESTSVGRSEALVVQEADMEAGTWTDVPLVARERLRDDWVRSTFSGRLRPVAESVRQEAVGRIIDESRPDVEVAEVALLVAGAKSSVVHEKEPFELVVGVDVRRRVPSADVNVYITRSDGVYVFWQSSGQVGMNLAGIEGEYDVAFRFEPNFFGGGEYVVTIEIGNGYDMTNNFPQSEIFDRRVGALTFTVEREWKMLDTGPLNYHFPVEVRSRTAVADRPSRAGAGA